MKRFKLILKSLISNDACVEGGRKHPWWIAIIMFFLSMILALIPIFTQTITKKGSSFATTNSYGLETSAERFVEAINDKKFVMEVKEQGKEKYLSIDQEAWDEAFPEKDDRGYHVFSHHNEDGDLALEVYYVADFKSTDLEDIINSHPNYDDDGEFVKWSKRYTSFMVFGKTEYVCYLFNRNGGAQVGSVVGDYKHFDAGYRINDLGKVTINGEEYDRSNITAELFGQYRDGVWANWVAFFDTAYLYQRGQLTWKTTLMMFGINAGLVIFMGLMLFVLTRGKHNPFRVITIFECMWIACWASLTPAILTTGLGFLIKSFSQMIFPLLLGVRIMWLSMKSLRPDYNVPQQQASSKQVKTVDTKPVKEKKSK